MGKQLGFYVNSLRCIGCRTCEIACKDKNDLGVGVKFRDVSSYEGGSGTDLYGYSISLACNHCANPACIPVCPTGALYKRAKDGIVDFEYELCNGCRRCEWVCPYGAPQFIEEDNKIMKCYGCSDYVDAEHDPACVAACPLRALHFGDIDEMKNKAAADGAKAGIVPSDFADTSLTNPSVIFNLHPEAVKRS
jgi:anaerobic dimethyl sulfoxide reductase subunit B (iron-sulfur subunit)